MAQYTSNIGLHQWEPEDNFLRTDFNTDFAKIDAAVKELETAVDGKLEQKADKSALAEVRTLAEGRASVKMGSYTGNGTSLNVKVGFRPSAVFIPIYNRYIAAAVNGQSTGLISITNTGFTVDLGNDSIVTPNKEGTVYTYLAFR